MNGGGRWWRSVVVSAGSGREAFNYDEWRSVVVSAGSGREAFNYLPWLV